MNITFGIQFKATANLISEKLDQEVEVSIGLGTNTLPDKEQVDRLVKEGIAEANSALNTDDFRLVKLEDRGIATPQGLDWSLT
jgi:hypothetical protein